MRTVTLPTATMLTVSASVALLTTVWQLWPEKIQAVAGVRFAPYTVVLSESEFTPEGQLRSTRTYVVSVREDGSRAEWRTLARPTDTEPKFSTVASIFDVSQKRDTSFYFPIRSKSTVPLSERRLHALTAERPPNCVGPYEELGNASEPILGFQTVHVLHPVPRTPNRRKTVLYVEQWRAPELGCEVLREMVYRTNEETGEKQYLVLMKEAVVVSRVATPELFNVPGDFVERSPIEVAREYARLHGRECPRCVELPLQRADERYRRIRQQAGWE